jgi:hypothetical protein
VPVTRLSVAGDPALALVVRIFIGSVTEQWSLPEPIRDDLRLAGSELFSGAVEAGGGEFVTFELSDDDGSVELRADDVPVGAEEPGLGGHEGGDGEDGEGQEAGGQDEAGWMGRFSLIRALFPDADVAESTVRIRVARPD